MKDDSTLKSGRIWELDAFRGLFILGMVVVHAIYDLRFMFGFGFSVPPIYDFVKEYGSLLFILLSGVCVTLGSRSVKRGAIVFGCGMLLTAATLILASAAPENFAGCEIYFGILHLLGLCMLLYPLFKRLPLPVLGALAVLFVFLGYVFAGIHTSYFLPMIVGVTPPDFFSADYFPLFPGLGWFLGGAFLGRTAYKSRRSLMPRFPAESGFCRFFRFCGRHSLGIYLLHQPLVYGLLWVVLTLCGVIDFPLI